MKRAIVAACLSAAFAVALTAQAPAQQPPAGTSGSTAGVQDTTKSSQSGARTVSLTGCLKAGDAAGTYELTNAEMSGAAGHKAPSGEAGEAGEAAGAAGTAGAKAGGMRTVMLNAASDVNLAPHVGHKIEVTGSMSGRSSGSTGTTGSSSTAGSSTAGAAGSTASSGGSARTLNVKSMKMISESCS